MILLESSDRDVETFSTETAEKWVYGSLDSMENMG